jgi:hypothetical protein
MRVQTTPTGTPSLREFSRLLPGVKVAPRFTATFERDRDDDPPYEGEFTAEFVDGRYEVAELTCRRVEDGEPITGEGLRRLPIGYMLALAASNYILEGRRIEGASEWTPFMGASPGDAKDGPTDDALRRVAIVYQLNLACGLAPTRAVEVTFELPRSTAGRWIAMARERGFLPAATAGASGARGHRGVD